MVDLSPHRHKKGLCLHEISAQLGVGDSNVSQWLKDSRRIPMARMNALADALDLDIIPDSIQSDLLILLRKMAPGITHADIRELTELIAGSLRNSKTTFQSQEKTKNEAI